MSITILTPLYNGFEYFEQCYNSIVSQTDVQWIWLIGINGHKDDTIYNQLCKLEDPRILVKKYDTIGKVATLNAMVKDTDSQYIALCDVDDIWIPRKIEIQRKFILQNPIVDVFAGGCTYIGDHSGSPNIPYGLIDLDTLFKINPVINALVNG